MSSPPCSTTSAAAYGTEDSAWREFNVKLKHVKDRMLTRKGKALAEGRHRFMEGFFEAQGQELEARK